MRPGKSLVSCSLLLICSAAVAATGGNAGVVSVSSGQHQMSPKKALTDIHKVNRFQITMAKLAIDKARTPQVKQFARKMLRDHTQIEKQLDQVARNENIKVPNEPFLSGEHQGVADELSATQDVAFDKAYMEATRQSNSQALRTLENIKSKVSDPGVQKLASELIPRFQHNEELAQNIYPGGQSHG